MNAPTVDLQQQFDNLVEQANERKDKLTERVGWLLRQAEKASTPEEAKAFAEGAQKIISKYSISEAVARARIAAIETRAIPTHRKITIGERGKRGLSTYVNLFLEIARANDVRCNIAHNSTWVAAFGFEADIDMCELIYTHLAVQMVQASNDYLKSGEFKTETISRPIYEKGDVIAYTFNGPRHERIVVGYEDVQVHGATARKSFQKAFARAIGARLRTARNFAIEQAESARREELEAQARQAAAQAAAQAEREDAELSALDEDDADEDMELVADIATEVSASTAVVLKAKTGEVDSYYKKNSDARGSWRGNKSSATAGYSNRAAQAGSKAGRTASLGIHREIG